MGKERALLQILLLDDTPLPALYQLEKEVRLLFGQVNAKKLSPNNVIWTAADNGDGMWPNGPNAIACCALGSSRIEVVSNLAVREFREMYNLILIDRDWSTADPFDPGDLGFYTWDQLTEDNYCGNLFTYLSNELALTGTVLALITDYLIDLPLMQKLVDRGFTFMLPKNSHDRVPLTLLNVLMQADRDRRRRSISSARAGDRRTISSVRAGDIAQMSIQERLYLAHENWPMSPNYATIVAMFLCLERGAGTRLSVYDLAKSILAKEMPGDDDIVWTRRTLNAMKGGLERVGLIIEDAGELQVVVRDLTLQRTR